MTAVDADPLLRRLERRALGFCVVAAVVAWWARGGRVDVASGVLGGAVLIGVSYWAIRSSIDGILALAVPSASGVAPTAEAAVPGPRRGRALGYGLRFVGRYAVLGVLAYVMLVWLRLHPVGLILGVSSIAVAAAWEAAEYGDSRRAREVDIRARNLSLAALRRFTPLFSVRYDAPV